MIYDRDRFHAWKTCQTQYMISNDDPWISILFNELVATIDIRLDGYENSLATTRNQLAHLVAMSDGTAGVRWTDKYQQL